MEDVKVRPRSSAVPLIAAALSFIYHLSLAVLANYVPLDRAGASVTLWLYSWTACVVGYFGLIAIIAKRPGLSKFFAYLLFLDSVFSALWRFAVLEYVLHNVYHDRCDGRSRSRPGDGCGVRFELFHALAATVLSVVTLGELFLANAVRRYAGTLEVEAMEGEEEGFEAVQVVVEKGDLKT